MRGLPRRLPHSEEATFVEHLEELRWRIIIVLGVLALTTIVAFAFHGHVLDWLNHALPADRRQPVTLGVAEPFTVSLTVSVYAGFLLALPVILWQLWSFLAPAFDPSIERRVLGLVAFATALGVTGLAFGYWILLPRALHWLTNYDDTHFTHLVQAKPYYAFTAPDGRARPGEHRCAVISAAPEESPRRLLHRRRGRARPARAGSRDYCAGARAHVGALRGLDLACRPGRTQATRSARH
jgi:hypothetical protein